MEMNGAYGPPAYNPHKKPLKGAAPINSIPLQRHSQTKLIPFIP